MGVKHTDIVFRCVKCCRERARHEVVESQLDGEWICNGDGCASRADLHSQLEAVTKERDDIVRGCPEMVPLDETDVGLRVEACAAASQLRGAKTREGIADAWNKLSSAVLKRAIERHDMPLPLYEGDTVETVEARSKALKASLAIADPNTDPARHKILIECMLLGMAAADAAAMAPASLDRLTEIIAGFGVDLRKKAELWSMFEALTHGEADGSPCTESRAGWSPPAEPGEFTRRDAEVGVAEMWGEDVGVDL